MKIYQHNHDAAAYANYHVIIMMHIIILAPTERNVCGVAKLIGCPSQNVRVSANMHFISIFHVVTQLSGRAKLGRASLLSDTDTVSFQTTGVVLDAQWLWVSQHADDTIQPNPNVYRKICVKFRMTPSIRTNLFFFLL